MSEPITLAKSLLSLNPAASHRSGSRAPSGRAAGSPRQADGDAALRKACAEMESLFLDQLFREMRKTIPKTGFMHGGHAEEVYTSLLDTQVARELSAAGGIGLAPMLEIQLRERMASSTDDGVD